MKVPMLNVPRPLKTELSYAIKDFAGVTFRRAIADSWDYTAEEFWAYQRNQFLEIYQFARDRVPYYRDHPDQYPKQLKDGHILEMLRVLPVLEKMKVKEANQAFWATPPLRFTTYHSTSGTTGSPLRIAATLGQRAFTQATQQEWLFRLCGTRHPRTLYLSGFMTPSLDSRDLYWRGKLRRSVWLSIYSLARSHMGAIADLLSEFRPQLIFGYSSAIYQLARLFEHEPLGLQENCVAVVTSETLHPDWRQTIEHSIARKVYNLYGSQEGAAMAIECDYGTMHINPLIGIIEIVDEKNRPVPKGESGRMLLTSLLRRSMPLIRYDIGDAAESTGYATGCSCGLGWPSIGTVQGRTEDLVRTRDGRHIGMLGYSAIRHLPGVKEAQLIQTSYESFRLVLVPDEGEKFDRAKVENMFQNELQNRLQFVPKVEFDYAESIRRGPNGKFKAVVVDFENKD